MMRKIKIKIGNSEREYDSYSPEQESLMRNAAEEINKMIGSVQGTYSTKNITDIIETVAFNLCMSNIKLKKDLENAVREVAELKGEIDVYLKNAES